MFVIFDYAIAPREKLMRLILFVLSITFASPTFAETLIAEFTSPTFGGSPLLGNYFMSRAEMFRPEKEVILAERTQADYFIEQLQRRALSTLSTSILAELSDPAGAESGTYFFEDFTLSYIREIDQITITIIDGETITEVTLPTITFEQ